MELLERAEALEQAVEALARARAGRGSVLLLSGEAGVGKTRLLEALVDAVQGRRLRILLGHCEDLLAAPPLGPLREIAELSHAGLPWVRSLLERQACAGDVCEALLEALDVPHQPTLLIVEDLHWADDATLDLLRHLGRRIAALPVLLVLSYRDEALAGDHPLTRLLGELPAEVCDRVALSRLSRQAVARLCALADRPQAGVYEATGGLPFHVAELLACPVADAPVALPLSPSAATQTRMEALSDDAREWLRALCVAPGPVGRPLASALSAAAGDGLQECLRQGVLAERGGRLVFRHELTRHTVLEQLPPEARRERHAAMLAAMLRSERPASLSQLAHHAHECGDSARLMEFAPLLAAQAAVVGAHRQAATLLAAALAVAGGTAPEVRAQLRESWADATMQMQGATAQVIEARREALELWRRAGRIERAGESLRWLSRLLWQQGDAWQAERCAAEAVELLQSHPPGVELAWAYATRAQLHMLQDRFEPARLWGERAVSLATRLGEREALSHALNTLGCVQLFTGQPDGEALLERSLQLAHQGGFREQAARAYCNLAEHAVVFKDFERAQRWLSEGVAFGRRFDLDAWTPYLLGWQAQLRLEQGRLDEALALAAEVLALPRLTAVTRLPALTVRVWVGLRRGRREAQPLADEALADAWSQQESHRILPLLLARAETAWLAGDAAAGRAWLERLDGRPELAANPWTGGAYAVWMARCGGDAGFATDGLARPWALELQGRPGEAAAHWAELGLPFEAAMALLRHVAADPAAAPDALDEAARLLQPLGARPALARVQALARELGLPPSLWREPVSIEQHGARDLTAHEQQVLALLAQGLGNGDIAVRLGLGRRTVEHHVSTVLVKLGAQGRSQAVAMAWRDRGA